jgi:hypothetical protein
MVTFLKGDRVMTPIGAGAIAYARMAPPDYSTAEAYSVVLDDQRNRPGYTSTLFAAEFVTADDRADRFVGSAAEVQLTPAPAKRASVPGFEPFARWIDVLAHARNGGALYYHAPLDCSPVRLTDFQVKARTIRIWPLGSRGRGKGRTADPFTADAGHLDRFYARKGEP